MDRPKIHPTAVVHPAARLGAGVEVGPYVVIEGEVSVGPGCVLGPAVHLTGRTELGARNRIHAGVVLGDAPQDLRYKDAPTRLVIGDDNVFREHATVHRSNREDEPTRLGSGNLVMAGAHVGHNCQVGNGVILASGVLLAGHVSIDDRAFLSGHCRVHQFCRVGRLAMMQGGAAISKDLPPFCNGRGDNGLCGLNVIGLRRAGVGAGERLELRRVYHVLFRSDGLWSERLARATADFPGGAAAELVRFAAGATRGLCRDVGRRAGRGGEDGSGQGEGLS